MVEPGAPGADEIVVSLYDTIRHHELSPFRDEVRSLFSQNACLRSRAARYIASAGSLLLDNRRAAACCTDSGKVHRYAAALAARLLPAKHTRGSEQLRFLSGITPQGFVFYADTVRALADHYLVFEDTYGAASRIVLQLIRNEALARGYDIITCPCALFPDDRIDHVLIPELRLAFLTSNSWHRCAFEKQRNIHCTRFEDAYSLAAYRSRLRFNRRASAELLAQAVLLMAQAKACHDQLENYYRSSVDFSQVEQIQEHCAQMLMLPPK